MLEQREITAGVNPLLLKLLLSRGEEEHTLDDGHDLGDNTQNATSEQSSQQEHDTSSRLVQIEVVQAQGTHQQGEQAGNTAALARGAIVEHTVKGIGSLISKLTPLLLKIRLILITVGHVGLSAAIGALHAIHFLLSAILLSALGTIMYVHNSKVLGFRC